MSMSNKQFGSLIPNEPLAIGGVSPNNTNGNSLGGGTIHGEVSKERNNERTRSLYRATVRCSKKGAISSNSIPLTFENLISDLKQFKINAVSRGGVEYTSLLADYSYLRDIKESVLPESLQRLKRQLRDLTHGKQILERQIEQLEAKQKFFGSRELSLENARRTRDNIDIFVSRCATAPSLLEASKLESMLRMCKHQSAQILQESDCKAL